MVSTSEETRLEYLEVGVALHKYALKGNWKEAKMLIERNKNVVRMAITGGWATALHVAAGANHVDFVEGLMEFMEDGGDDVALRDYNGNTAFFLAAGVGNTRLAEIMMTKNEGLPIIRGEKELFPLHFAVIQGKTLMADFLYSKTVRMFQQRDWDILFLTAVNADIYGNVISFKMGCFYMSLKD